MRNGYTVTYQMRKRQRQRRQKIIGYVLKIAAAVLIAFLIVRFVCFSYTIQGDSMMPTIENGEKTSGEPSDLSYQRTEQV